jgi:hypothetical protein
VLPNSLIARWALKEMLETASQAPNGAIVEIGVYQGGSACELAKLGRPLYLYDTFEGLPFAGPLDGNPKGKFSDTSAEAVQKLIPQAHVIKGIFPQSLIPMPPVAFVHADADQYESTKAICQFMPPLMVDGGVIWFDDYGVLNCQGCTKAVDEHFDEIIRPRSTRAMVVIRRQ